MSPDVETGRIGKPRRPRSIVIWIESQPLFQGLAFFVIQQRCVNSQGKKKQGQNRRIFTAFFSNKNQNGQFLTKNEPSHGKIEAFLPWVDPSLGTIDVFLPWYLQTAWRDEKTESGDKIGAQIQRRSQIRLIIFIYSLEKKLRHYIKK